MLITPYFRTIMDFRNGINCVEEPESNYKPYNIFCLTSRLSELVKYAIQPISVPINNKMVVTIVLKDKNGETIEPEEPEVFQNKINNITGDHPNHCFLISTKGFDQYPSQWVNSIFPYLDLGEKYDAYIEKGSIYVDLSNESFYKDIYTQLLNDILNQMHNLYKQGAIVTNELVAKKWDLHADQFPGFRETLTLEEQLDPDLDVKAIERELYNTEITIEMEKKTGLYFPRWTSTHIAKDRIKFLYDREANIPLKFDVGLNLVVRHYIALRIENLLFIDEYCIITGIDNIIKLRALMGIMNELKNISTGKVVIIPLISLANIEILKARIPFEGVETTVYRTNDRLRPYTLSFLIPINYDPVSIAELVTALNK